jgi:hypothetical protein
MTKIRVNDWQWSVSSLGNSDNPSLQTQRTRSLTNRHDLPIVLWHSTRHADIHVRISAHSWHFHPNNSSLTNCGILLQRSNSSPFQWIFLWGFIQ